MSNSSVFNIRAKVLALNSLQDLQLNEREFQTAGALTLKANDVRGAISNSKATLHNAYHQLLQGIYTVICESV